MSNYIDAHCHILSDAEIRDAVSHGVGQFVINATRLDDWNAVIDLATRDNVYGAIGVHPWYVSEIHDGWDTKLVELLTANPKLMVGEIGLDKNRPDMEKQIAVFVRQLQIAHDLHRVAHIHCVGAWGKIMDILRTCDLPSAMVLHAFSGASELVPELAKMGAYFSFGTSICDARHARMRQSLDMAPLMRVLVESDAPDKTMPITIPDTVAEIAKIRGLDVEQIANQIYNNTTGLLNDGQI